MPRSCADSAEPPRRLPSMLAEPLKTELAASGMAAWADWLDEQLARFYQRANHGDCPDWLEALRRLPELTPSQLVFDADTVQIGRAADCSAAQRETLRRQLKRLIPWRKGPFRLFGVDIDGEWRSGLKWRRLQDNISPLSGRAVLDVGCGNGYYGWRMLGAGARLVAGIDKTLKHVMQHRAIARYAPRAPFEVLPFSLEELTAGRARTAPVVFDTVFSMGVIYHQRDPLEHLRALRSFLREDGELVLESLVIDGGAGAALRPPGRYAGMGNVWAVPSVKTLRNWLSEAGFSAVEVADVARTTPAEQRVTEWTFEVSLADFLDPNDPSLTLEGHPAPQRALLVCQRGGRGRG